MIKKFKLPSARRWRYSKCVCSNLANLERQKIDNELKEKKKLIKELETILKSAAKIKGIIKTELNELTEKFGDDRKTQVIERGVERFFHRGPGAE